MNERIKELFDQATFDESRMVDGFYHPYIPLQFHGEPVRLSVTREQYHKFAELIVRECYESCRGQVLDKETADTNELTYNDAVGDCAIGLLQHFGIME
jgi:hypothetical protein